MKASKKGTSWGPKRVARLAAGLAVVAITAVGIGAASTGANAANGWRVSTPTTTAAPATTAPIAVTASTKPPLMDANGW
jgi:hypothetical protein